jgi:predicted metal-binding membrane protein
LLLRRDRLIIALCLVVICLLSWYYLLTGAGTGMSALAMSTWQFPPPLQTADSGHWPLSYWATMAAMWWVMMIAMMLPSAAPMVLLYARVQRHNWKRAGVIDALVPTLSFVFGYLAVWLVFGLLATGLQWTLEHLGLVHRMMMWSNSRVLSGMFLLLAGGYQFSPLKGACLSHCRSPAGFLTRHWRSGRLGALCLGWLHGMYCVGCCWVLMLLLFVGGIMNLVWIAGLALVVLLEKLLPRGEWLARASGTAMLATGGWLLLG